jgi:ATP-dependent Lon protease
VQGMSTEARAACKRELKRLKIIPPQSPEHGVLRNYLDWMCALPWGKSSYDDPETKRIDRDFLTRARQQLVSRHNSMESDCYIVLNISFAGRRSLRSRERQGTTTSISGDSSAAKSSAR